MTIPALATVLLLAAASSPLLAQPVYRCGPEGRSYSDRPCTEGRVVDVADARDARQRRDAENAAAAQRRLAQDLTAQRHERERAAAAQGSGLAGIARPKAVEFTPPSADPAAAPRRAGKRKPAPRMQPHATWQATSPPPSR